MDDNAQTNNLKTGLLMVFLANAINLLISLVNGFVLPKYLSVESYADIKTYQLFANYIGVLALGYSDGLYLEYGGKKMNDVGAMGINTCRSNMVLFQGAITIIGIISGLLLHNNILLITCVSIIPVNVTACYKNIFQAVGEFKPYSKILNYTAVLSFAGSMILLFFIKSDNSLYYIAWYAVVSFIIWFLIERKMIAEYHHQCHWLLNKLNLIDNIKSGIVLMLGNFSSILMTSIDRWFVKGLLTTVDFAFYSFIVSVENLIAIFITPVVTTMYNYICITTDMRAIRRIKRICLILSLFLVSSAFPVKFILEVYLQKYLLSKYVLFILFPTEIFYMLIKGIYVNIYKARKQQMIYLKQLLVVVGIGAVLNIIAYFITHSNEGIAFATLASVVIWYVICCLSVKEIAPDWKENLLVAIAILLFIVTGFFMDAIPGFLVYVGAILIFSFVLQKEALSVAWNIATSMIRRKIKK